MNNPTFKDLVGVKHPIAVMAMNRVSDVKLAVACSRAGILPSLSIFNYYVGPGTIGYGKARDAFFTYNEQTNSAPVLLSCGVDTLVDDGQFKLIEEYNIKTVEVLFDSPHENTITPERIAKRDRRILELKEQGVVVFIKALNIVDIDNIPGIAGIILKGPNAAGRVVEDGDTLVDRIRKCRERYPDLHIIANGGIGDSADLKEVLDAGAIAGGLGTIFAAAEECAISTETKLKMVEASAEDVQKLKGGAQQHALIFSELTKDVHNNTHGLNAGIKSPTLGHVFAGTGIGKINAIKPVQQIVNELIKDL